VTPLFPKHEDAPAAPPAATRPVVTTPAPVSRGYRNARPRPADGNNNASNSGSSGTRA
jgi:hypothetical protein